MSPTINLEELYSRVMPYLADPLEIRHFLDNLDCEEMDEQELIERLERALNSSEGTLRTDFRIVLNTIK